VIAVFGAGPVGSLLALFIARRGHEVVVYERRSDLRLGRAAAGRSINLAVSTRGLYALHQMGLDEKVLERAIPMLGRMVHAEGEAHLLRYGRDDREYINSMSRGELNALLLTEAERTGRVRIEFEERLLSYDPGRNVARIRSERTGTEREIHPEVAFGADGSASAMRKSIAPGASEEVLDFGYKELTLPAGPGGSFLLEKNALHIWPRKSFMLIALPNLDGSFTCTLFLSFDEFAKIGEAAAAEKFFAATFPDVLALVPDLGARLAEAPLGRMTTVKCSPWSRGTSLLLGDAAHAIVPFFGQGMNAGFEDCTVLDGILAREPRWDRAFAELFATRKPDADAIADLAVENFVEMRDKVADKEFVLWKEVEAELSRRMGGAYLNRYQLVTFTRIPYQNALEAGRIQQEILRELCAGKAFASEVDYRRGESLVRERLSKVLEGALSA
jgi:kynurenine 3-monooxygenase